MIGGLNSLRFMLRGIVGLHLKREFLVVSIVATTPLDPDQAVLGEEATTPRRAEIEPPDRLSSARPGSCQLDPGDAPLPGRVLTGGRGQRYVDWSFRGLRGGTGWALRPTLPTLQVYAKYYLA